MDLDSVLAAASTVKRLRMYPYFDVANYILMCLAVRDDHTPPATATGSQAFSRVHPLSCWVGSMMMCFAGGILGNFLLGEPLITPFRSGRDVLLATAIWYFINYSPFDCVYKLCSFAPVKGIVYFLKEIRRVNKVYHGILFALKSFPGAYILVAIYGVLKGSASNHMKLFQRLVCGSWQPASIELLKPSVVTKASSVAAIFFLLDFKGHIDVEDSLLYLAFVIFFIFLRILSFFGIDPFLPFENLFCSVFMGGILDALKRAQKPPEAVETSTKSKTSNGRKPKEE